MLIADGWKMLADDFAHFDDVGTLVVAAVRLTAAALLGGLLGFERERAHKSAGMRTHMLVALGCAFFALAPQLANIELSRVIQGIVTGIGFLGGGTILKLSEEHRVKGLTTAASIWMAAAVGVGAGIGRIAVVLLCTLLALVILHTLHDLEDAMRDRHSPPPPPQQGG